MRNSLAMWSGVVIVFPIKGKMLDKAGGYLT